MSTSVNTFWGYCLKDKLEPTENLPKSNLPKNNRHKAISHFLPTLAVLYSGIILLVVCSCNKATRSVNADSNRNIAARYALQAKPAPQMYCQIAATPDSLCVFLKIPTDILPASAHIAWQLIWKENAKKGISYQSDTIMVALPQQNTGATTPANYQIISSTFPAPPPTIQNPILVTARLMLKNGTLLTQIRQMLPPISKHSPINYALKAVASDSILFENNIRPPVSLRLNYRQKNCTSKTQIAYFKPIRQLALPPHINKTRPLLPEKPDNIFEANEVILLQNPGLYILQNHQDDADIAPNDPAYWLKGKSILITEKDFPKISTSQDLIEALRYITRNSEYQQLKKAPDPKAAADSFWLQRAGSYDRGRKLIKEFYGRVQRANALFSDYREGWQTDMGLIYIIFGHPQSVYEKNNRQVWDYTRPTQASTLRFVFEKEQLPFGDFFALQRNPDYKDAWNDAVYEWRKGIIQNPSND